MWIPLVYIYRCMNDDYSIKNTENIYYFVIMDLNFMGNHWVLLVADVTKRNIYYIDSKNTFNNTKKEFILFR